METDGIDIYAEKLGHLGLGEPDGLFFRRRPGSQDWVIATKKFWKRNAIAIALAPFGSESLNERMDDLIHDVLEEGLGVFVDGQSTPTSSHFSLDG